MKAKRAITVLLLGAGLISVAPLAAQAETPAPGAAKGAVAVAPGKAAVAATTEATATVVEIDAAKRVVTLKRADGKVVSITCGDEVRNFDKIKVGDTVRAKYTMALSLELKKGKVEKGAPVEESGVTRAPAGAQPAAAVGRKVTAMAEVIAVDAAKHIVTLRGPAGNEVDLDVEDPAQLQNIKKGDHVEVVYAEALAISLESAAPAPAK